MQKAPLIWRSTAANGAVMVVENFVFPDGDIGRLTAFHRGLGPIGDDLRRHEDPIGIYTETGDYYSIHVDLRESKLRKRPTFSIGEVNYYHPITGFFTMGGKVDPATGRMVLELAKKCRSPKRAAKVMS